MGQGSSIVRQSHYSGRTILVSHRGEGWGRGVGIVIRCQLVVNPRTVHRYLITSVAVYIAGFAFWCYKRLMGDSAVKVLIEAFLDYLEAEKNASIHTRLAYERDLREFTRFLEDSLALSSGGVVTGVKESDIMAFAANLHGTRKKATIARKLSSIKSFFAFLLRKEIIKKDPSALITRPKVEKRLPTVLTVEEAKSLVEAPQSNEGRR